MVLNLCEEHPLSGSNPLPTIFNRISPGRITQGGQNAKDLSNTYDNRLESKETPGIFLAYSY